MAKKSMRQTNIRRKRLVSRYEERRRALKSVVMDKGVSIAERFDAALKLAKLPRNSAKVRVRNRCDVTGRPRGYCGKFRISRIVLRELASFGRIPGVVKSSW